jgi:hypothetical protein
MGPELDGKPEIHESQNWMGVKRVRNYSVSSSCMHFLKRF